MDSRERLRSLTASVMLSSAFLAPLQSGPIHAAVGAAPAALHSAFQGSGIEPIQVSAPAALPSPLTGPQLRKLERFAASDGSKDVPLNKGVTDGLGITTAADAPIKATQIAREFSGRKRYFSFLPNNRGYILMAIDDRSMGIYHALPSLQAGKAFGRNGAAGPLSPLPDGQAREELHAELKAWAYLADVVNVAAR